MIYLAYKNGNCKKRDYFIRVENSGKASYKREWKNILEEYVAYIQAEYWRNIWMDTIFYVILAYNGLVPANYTE